MDEEQNRQEDSMPTGLLTENENVMQTHNGNDGESETAQSTVTAVGNSVSSEDFAGFIDEKATVHTDLGKCQEELDAVKIKLLKTEKQLEKANIYNDDLRSEIEKFSSELQSKRNAAQQNKADAETQTDEYDLQEKKDTVDGLSKDQPIVIQESSGEAESQPIVIDDAVTKDNDKPEVSEVKADTTTLADELRATAEAAVQETGYVYDEKSGLYYDYKTGYYYNAEKALYYDPNTGTYFYYNSESGQYEFHSQVDVSQYTTSQANPHYNYYDQGHDQQHYPSHREHDHPEHRGYTQHRQGEGRYDHRPPSRRDREDSADKSYHRDRPRSSSSRKDRDEVSSSRSRAESSDKKNRKPKRLHIEEMEHHKRKKNKRDKKKKKKKSSKDRKQDNKERSSASKERQPKSVAGKKCSEDYKVKSDSKVKLEDPDEKSVEDSEDYVESFDLEDKSFVGELYESFDNENNTSSVSTDEGSELGELYEDLGDDNDSSKSGGFLKHTDDLESRDRNCGSSVDHSPDRNRDNDASYAKSVHRDHNSHTKNHRTGDSKSSNDNPKSEPSRTNSSSESRRKSRNDNPKSEIFRTNSSSESRRKSRNDNPKSEISRTNSRSKSRRSHRKSDKGRSKSSGAKSDVQNDRAMSSDSGSLCTGESELESGEITSSSSEEMAVRREEESMHCDYDSVSGDDSVVYPPEDHTDDVIMAEEELVSKWPPCIRVIVTDSDILDPGTLFIVTCTGASVGREKEVGHTLLIPDINVSKTHADIKFDENEHQYYITDLASQNGTFLNEERISEPKVTSKPEALTHGDTLQFGCTRLLLHIHDGMDTCDECEPGQVQAQIQAQNQPQKEIVILSKKEKLKQQRDQLKQIKKKYGLKNSSYMDNMSAINNPSYTDKAEERRKTVGSDNPHQPDEAPASVHKAISGENKGHKMLKKLGWTEGESLGKDNEGIRQPISVTFRANQSAGLGSGVAGQGSVEEAGDLRKRQKWLDVQSRYNKVEGGAGDKALTTPDWVQGNTQES